MTDRLISARMVTETGEVLDLHTLSYADGSNDDLIREYLLLRRLRDAASSRMHSQCLALQQRMEQDGATEFVGGAGTATLKEKGVTYDSHKLDSLLEFLSREELVKSGALTLAHTRTVEVPRSWNATKLRPFRKRGRDVAEAIDGARSVGGHEVSIKGAE